MEEGVGVVDTGLYILDGGVDTGLNILADAIICCTGRYLDKTENVFILPFSNQNICPSVLNSF